MCRSEGIIRIRVIGFDHMRFEYPSSRAGVLGDLLPHLFAFEFVQKVKKVRDRLYPRQCHRAVARSGFRCLTCGVR